MRSVAWICVSYLSFWSVSRGCFHFCRRLDPLVIIEQLVVGSFFPEREWRVEKESVFFWEVSRGPSEGKDVGNSEHSSPLPGTGERNDCIQVLLFFSHGPGALMGAGLTSKSDATAALPRRCSLMHGTTGFFVPTSSQCCGFSG